MIILVSSNNAKNQRIARIVSNTSTHKQVILFDGTLFEGSQMIHILGFDHNSKAISRIREPIKIIDLNTYCIFNTKIIHETKTER